MSYLGTAVSLARRKASMSVAALAAASGVNQRVIFYIEAGFRSDRPQQKLNLQVNTVVKIARALKVPPEKLLADAVKDI